VQLIGPESPITGGDGGAEGAGCLTL